MWVAAKKINEASYFEVCDAFLSLGLAHLQIYLLKDSIVLILSAIICPSEHNIQNGVLLVLKTCGHLLSGYAVTTY